MASKNGQNNLVLFYYKLQWKTKNVFFLSSPIYTKNSERVRFDSMPSPFNMFKGIQ